MTSDIAIIGISVEIPGTRDVHEFWDVVATGRALTRRYPPGRVRAVERGAGHPSSRASVEPPAETEPVYRDGCYLDRPDLFDPEFFGMTPKQAATTEPHLRLAMRAMYLALEDAGYDGPRVRGSRTGVYADSAEMADRLSHLLDLRGPSTVVDGTCSASLVAVHQAKNALLLGDCDTAIVAGSRIVADPVRHPDTAYGSESSDGRTRTLDERADGTGLGEGAGAVVLKRLGRARADGDRVYAVIKGSAVHHDGTADGATTTPGSDSQAELLTAAWVDAGIDPRTLGYHELHGAATRLGDRIEHEGLRRAFAKHTADRGFCAVGTVKANIGHLSEGSGVLGLIKTALVLHHRAIPPLAGFERPNPAIDFAAGPVRVPTTLESWTSGPDPRRAAVSAFDLGGPNCHVVLEEYDGDVAAAMRTPSILIPAMARLFTLSAHSEESLRMLVHAYAEYFAAGRFAGTDLVDLCYTTNLSRSAHRYRLALVATSTGSLRKQLDALAGARVEDLGFVYSNLESRVHRRGEGIDGPIGGSAHVAAARYVETGELDLKALYRGTKPAVVGLPGYRFDERRCRIDFPADWSNPPVVVDPATDTGRYLPGALTRTTG